MSEIMYENVIDEGFNDGVVEKYRCSSPFLSVFAVEGQDPHFFIFTQQSISNLNTVQLNLRDNSAVVDFNLGFDKIEDFQDSDNFSLFEQVLDDNGTVLGKQLEYKVPREELELFVNKLNKQVSVMSYKIFDLAALHELFIQWFLETYKEQLVASVEKSKSPFKGDYEYMIRKTAEIGASECLKNNKLTYWDMFDIESLFNNSNALTEKEKLVVEFQNIVDFVKIIR